MNCKIIVLSDCWNAIDLEPRVYEYSTSAQ